MSLPELTDQMTKLGAVDALNLDGGGSTCLSVRGLVINSPSDGQVRRVADSLLVFAPGQKPIPEPKPSGLTEPLFRVTAGDAPLLIPDRPAGDGGAWVYGTRNGGAFVDQKGRLYGYRAGDAEAVAQGPDGNVTKLWSVRVAGGPAGKMLTAWKDGTLEITVRDVNNNPVQGQEVQLKQPDGTMTEVTTGEKGIARVPAGWLKDETAPVALTSGVLTASWPPAGK
jgi:hypothetical protein